VGDQARGAEDRDAEGLEGVENGEGKTVLELSKHVWTHLVTMFAVA